MSDPTNDEHEPADTGTVAADYARRLGLDAVAAMIEAGEADDAPEMRTARLIRQRFKHGPEVLKAFADPAAAERRRAKSA